jgi:hypothetical protein
MTSQQLGDIALAEHRAVMAALVRSCIKRPTDEEYEAQLQCVRSEMSCVITGSPSSLPSPDHSSWGASYE